MIAVPTKEGKSVGAADKDVSNADKKNGNCQHGYSKGLGWMERNGVVVRVDVWLVGGQRRLGRGYQRDNGAFRYQRRGKLFVNQIFFTIFAVRNCAHEASNAD